MLGQDRKAGHPPIDASKPGGGGVGPEVVRGCRGSLRVPSDVLGPYFLAQKFFREGEMTEDRLELVARKLCEIRGVDPEKVIGHSVEGSGGWHYSPAWRLALNEVRARVEMDSAFAAVPP